MVIVGYAIPGFLFAVMLIIVFAGGRVLDWFPLRGLVSYGQHRTRRQVNRGLPVRPATRPLSLLLRRRCAIWIRRQKKQR